VLLIDEVDKADLEFPNDLLHELDRMRFRVLETGDEIVATQRPIVIITSNNEKELPDAFLRRCVFHFIDFPAQQLMKRIVAGRHDSSVDGFYNVARALLVHSEAHLDAFDEAFLSVFRGVEAKGDKLREELLEWLRDAAEMRQLTPEEEALLRDLDVDPAELR